MVFLLPVVEQFQNVKRYRGTKRWWKAFMETVSKINDNAFNPDDPVWRLGGRAYGWWHKCGDVVVFAEYDAHEQHGYAIIIFESYDDSRKIDKEFSHCEWRFDVAQEEFDLLCEKW